MVSFKGKETKITARISRIADENRAPMNTFKISGDQSRRAAGNVPMMGSRKSVPISSSAVATAKTFSTSDKGIENAVGKCKSSAEVRCGRKALGDVSNLNNNRINQHRNELSNNPKIMKEKLVRINISQRKSVPLSSSEVATSQTVLAPDKVQGLENAVGKHESSVKVRNGRKALVDVSSLNYNKGNQHRHKPGNNPKILKEELVGINISQSKITTGSNTSRLRLTRNIVIPNVSSKPIKDDMKSSVRATGRLNIYVETSMRRKAHPEINSCQGTKNKQSNVSSLVTKPGVKLSRPRLSFTTQKAADGNAVPRMPVGDDTKRSARATGRLNIFVETSMRRKAHPEINSCQGTKNKLTNVSSLVTKPGVKLSRPRLSFTTQKAADGNAVPRMPVVARATSIPTNSKFKRASMTTHESNVEISTVGSACKNKVVGEPSSLGSGDNESASSRGCCLQKVESNGNSCSGDNVRAVISKPRCTRRRSYTSSLVSRSEIMGKFAEPAKFIKNDNIDDNTNPLEVVEYVDDIYQYYWSMEAQNPLPADYMTIQSDITPRMRGILVNWLIEVHLKFQLMQETLFLMVQLLDRVLSVVAIKRDQLQMVGLTALLLASKYEDYWHPKINELISISANLYTRDQMLSMERLVLKKLRFRLNLPTPYVFLLRFLKAAQSDTKLEHLAFYLVELCLGEYEALKYRPSLLCASAIYVARCTLQIAPAWTGLLTKYARYEESQLSACAEMILRFHKSSCLKPTKVIYEKYLSPDRSHAAALTAIDVLPP